LEIEKLIPILLPVLITAFFAAFIPRKIKERQRRITAGDDLRKAFAPALAQISVARTHKSTHNAPDLDGFLNRTLEGQATAFEQFKFFIASKNRANYDKAWDEYHKAVKGGVYVANFIGHNPFDYFEEKINGILAFTNKI
jgi:hypothetical protein